MVFVLLCVSSRYVAFLFVDRVVVEVVRDVDIGCVVSVELMFRNLVIFDFLCGNYYCICIDCL